MLVTKEEDEIGNNPCSGFGVDSNDNESKIMPWYV